MATEPGNIADQVRAMAPEFNLDPDFAVRVATAESSLNPKAIGPVTKSGERAFGTMQVMPSTAKELQARYGNDNIRQGLGYLKEMHEMFADVPQDQRPYFALAAYNWGPGHMIRAAKKVRESGGNPLNLGDYADVLPLETIKYVSKIRGGEGQAVPATTEPAPATTTTPAQRIQPLGQAIWSSLANEGERQRGAVGEAIQAAKGLVRPTGEATPQQALQASSRAILGGLGALQPVMAPEMTLGGVAGETAARTGAIPISPETGNLIGSSVAGLAGFAPTALRTGARLLSPSLRAIEKARGAGKAAETVTKAEQVVTKALKKGKAAEAVTVPTAAVEGPQHVGTQMGLPGMGIVPQVEYATPAAGQFSLFPPRTSLVPAAEAAAAPVATAVTEAKTVARTIREIKRDVAKSPKLLTPAMKHAIVGGMGAYMGMHPATAKGAAPYVFGLLAARLGYKAANAILSSTAGVRAFEALGNLSVGAPGVGRIVTSLLGEVNPQSPRRLTR